MKNRKRFFKGVILVVTLCFSAGITWIVRGVYYWWQVLPSENAILHRQGASDIFAGMRGPIGASGQDILYADTLSPMLRYGMGFPTTECSSKFWRKKGNFRNLANPLVLHMRSKGLRVAFCKGNEKSCWPVETVLANIALRLKYSDKTLMELYLMLFNFHYIDNALKEIRKNSYRDTTLLDVAVICKWISSGISVSDFSVRFVQRRAEMIAAGCHQPYVPVSSTETVKILSSILDYKASHVFESKN